MEKEGLTDLLRKIPSFGFNMFGTPNVTREIRTNLLLSTLDIYKGGEEDPVELYLMDDPATRVYTDPVEKAMFADAFWAQDLAK